MCYNLIEYKIVNNIPLNILIHNFINNFYQASLNV